MKQYPSLREGSQYLSLMLPRVQGMVASSGLSICGHGALTLPFKDRALNEALLSRERLRRGQAAQPEAGLVLLTGCQVPALGVNSICFQVQGHGARTV